ncbi:MAG TPA: hypothetical protein VK783_07035 [Bacteroidia bacterium]|jgi:hypothetical protein|nr:hypothetical protein [Bacteroidia bacterium]
MRTNENQIMKMWFMIVLITLFSCNKESYIDGLGYSDGADTVGTNTLNNAPAGSWLKINNTYYPLTMTSSSATCYDHYYIAGTNPSIPVPSGLVPYLACCWLASRCESTF